MVIDLTKEFGITSFEDSRLQDIDARDIRKFNINGQDVYIKKPFREEYLCAELIGDEILNILNIPRVKNSIGLINGKKYLISYAAYKKETEFIAGKDILIEFYQDNSENIAALSDFYGRNDDEYPYNFLNNLHTIWQAIDWYIAKYNINASTTKILDSLIMQFLFNSINNIDDFHESNWALLYQENNLDVYPKFDCDTLANFYFPEFSLVGFASKLNMSVYYTTNPKEPDDVLIQFLSVSEEKYLGIVIEMIKKLLSIGAEGIVAAVENKWGTNLIIKKDVFITEYNNRLKAVEEMLNEIKNKSNKKAI